MVRARGKPSKAFAKLQTSVSGQQEPHALCNMTIEKFCAWTSARKPVLTAPVGTQNTHM
jgi:hypothetical protein